MPPAAPPTRPRIVVRSSTLLVALLALCLAASDCNPRPPAEVGTTVEFAGLVASATVLQGGRRFGSGPQGVRFRLDDDPDVLYVYLMRTQEEDLARGILQGETDGAVRFADLTGLRVAGTATVRGHGAREVSELRVVREASR